MMQSSKTSVTATVAAFNEMQDDRGQIGQHYRKLNDWLGEMPTERLAQKRADADMLFRRMGITFAVYGENAGAERLIPFDIVPRILTAVEWRRLSRGLAQRVQALNAFLSDIYHEQEILKAGRIPPEHVLRNTQYRPEMQDIEVPGDVYAHIAGVDVVRADEGEFFVLEDNLRVPSGVSYMLEDRNVMMRLFPELFALRRGTGRALSRHPARQPAQRGTRRSAGTDRGGADPGGL